MKNRILQYVGDDGNGTATAAEPLAPEQTTPVAPARPAEEDLLDA